MRERDLLTGSIPKHLIRLALPSIGGMFSFVIFNLTDTYFVSQLGTNALAAMGFTFPVVLIVGAVSTGISMGAASLLSRAKGAGDHHKMERIATDGILLSLVFVVLVSIVGLFTMDQVFSLLGAEPDVIPLIKQYMSIWYGFVFVFVMPPVTDSCMRASGDMLRPFIVMLICAVFNIVLDPLLIHGYWIFPEMGIRGAALATMIARFLGMIATLSFAHFHHRLISFKYNSIREMFDSWKGILQIGIPSTTVMLMPQLLRSVLTNLVSSAGGTEAVAAIAVGTRTESFVTMIPYGIGLALVPLVGQNWGAGNFERVFETRNLVIKFSIIYGFFMFLVSIFTAKPVASIFTDDPAVIDLSAIYLWIMIFGMTGLMVTNWMSRMFTTLGRPKWTVLLNVGGILLVVIPLAFAGRFIGGYIGILAGICIGQLVVGAISIYLANKKMNPAEHQKT
ncbi:MAG TPA: MATE family efflux transporter [Clostridia bacterium]|nr:MATE family efflux transporter [Clostridia bacterium]